MRWAVISEIAAGMMRDAGWTCAPVSRCRGLEGDAGTSVGPILSDGTVLEVDVVVASLGSIRNVEWLDGASQLPGNGGWPVTPAAGPSTSTVW